MNQFLFLGQILISITMMSTEASGSAERILTYALSR